MLKGTPACDCACASSRASCAAISRLCFSRSSRSTSTPWCSMPSSTGTSGCSISSYRLCRAGTPCICGHNAWCSCSVTSASSAAVLGGALHRHFVEGEFLRAFAGDVLVFDGAHAEIALRRPVHVVIAGDAVPDVRLEHRVVAHAGEGNAVVQEYVRIVFEMVSDLERLRGSPGSAAAPPAPRRGRAARARPRSRGRAARRPRIPARLRMTRRRSRPACSRGSSFRCRRR